MVRRVLHLGPCNSRGGMATVIQNFLNDPPEGWETHAIDTHGGTIGEKVSRWFFSRSELRKMIQSEHIDLVHIHVTHSFSWWRKAGLMKICEKMNVPTVVQIHSGKFDSFCSGFSGYSVRRRLSIEGRKTLVLEERWLDLLRGVIPADSEVIPNSSEPICDRTNHEPSNCVKLLLLARGSTIKGHKFAIEIVHAIEKMGILTELTMTGKRCDEEVTSSGSKIRTLEWVSEEEKSELVREADFLISPSEYEGSSMSVIESMVCGLPCIVSSASRETVVNEKFMVDSEDPDEWAKRILYFHDEANYNTAVTETIEISQKFKPSNCRKRIGEVYYGLLPKQQ